MPPQVKPHDLAGAGWLPIVDFGPANRFASPLTVQNSAKD
jgi:hypothetical protein